MLNENRSQTVKFVLLTTPRTGSSYLLSLLSKHRNIKTVGEIFNFDHLPHPLVHEALYSPVNYLKSRVFKEHSSPIMAVGFKLLYSHISLDYFQKESSLMSLHTRHLLVCSKRLRDRIVRFNNLVGDDHVQDVLRARFEDVSKFLTGEKAIRIIHLKRMNALRAYVSLKKALITDEWQFHLQSQNSDISFELTYDECLSYFKKTASDELNYHNLFADHEIIEILYEDLCEQKDDVLTPLGTFARNA